MSKFIEFLKDVLNEKEMKINDLRGVLGKNSIYEYSKHYPTLSSAIKIANYLQVSLDYLVGKKEENNFKKYKIEQSDFFNKVKNQLHLNGVTIKKLCTDLGFSRTNFSRWKKGTNPNFLNIICISEYLKCDIDDILEKEIIN